MNYQDKKKYRRYLKLTKLNIDRILDYDKNESKRLVDAMKNLLDAYLLFNGKK